MYLSLAFSLLSVLKSSYNLQRVDIFERALSSPKSPSLFLITSIFWFVSILLFRGASIAISCVYIKNYFHNEQEESGQYNYKMVLTMFFMIFVIDLINILLKRLFERHGAFLSGAMSIVSPAKYICGKITDLEDSRDKTLKYLFSYFAFNIAFMYCLFLALVLLDNSKSLDERELHINCHKAEHGIGWSIFLPKLSVLVVTSLVMTVIHWNFSLKHLFISQSKHPKFMDVTTRKDTFPETFRSSESFAQSGFYYYGKREGLDILCCYDCGLEIYKIDWIAMRDIVLNNINIMHAASLLRYKATTNLFWYSLDTQLKKKIARKEDLCDLYAKSLSIKPQCNALKSFQIDFANISQRRLSFVGDDHLTNLVNYNRNFTLEDFIEAGFIRTSSTSLTCYNCLLHVSWSSKNRKFLQENVNSPWSLHSQYSKLCGSENCSHLKNKMNELRNRELTFPNLLFYQENRPSIGEYQLRASDYARAGFYCSIWNGESSEATIKCFEDCSISLSIMSPVSRTNNLKVPSKKLSLKKLIFFKIF